MAKVIDFSAGPPSAKTIKAAGYEGVMLYCSGRRESWMTGKSPSREYLDALDREGIKFGFVFQYRAGGSINAGDAGRGFEGGVEDAKAAQKYLNEVRCGGHPVYFAVDWDITLAEWNGRVKRYFEGAISVLGKQRVGVYGHSRVVAWAKEDDLVAEVAPGRVLGWVTRSWGSTYPDGSPRGTDYAAVFQGTHNVPGPDGVQVDINTVFHDEWGWRAIPYRPDSQENGFVDKTNLPRFDTRKLMAKHYTKGRTYNGVKHGIEYVTRHHVAGLAGLARSVDGRLGCWDIWQDRQASAHAVAYQEVPGQGKGIVGQLVRPEDTAWSNANSKSNARSYSIEHQNYAGADQDWPISDEVLKAGAQHAAEILYVEELGPPVFGKNIRDHEEFGATSCPYHLRNGHKYHEKWMNYCREHYQKLTITGGLFMALSEERQEDLARKIDRIHHELTHDFQSRYPESTFRDTLVGYVLELDRKVEDMHANMAPSVWKKLGEIADYLAKK